MCAAARDLELTAADIPSGMFRIASITDPEGNVITFAQDLRRTGLESETGL